ncbi:MAG: tRNA pseudouridine(55) synthase TruB [Ignavibacteria bacterium]
MDIPKGENYQNCLFIVDKPLDWTSAAIVNLFKKGFNIKKIGHTGTLDPKATGLLILCTGDKTKQAKDFLELDKEYEGVIKIGARTKTYDSESEEEYVADPSVVSNEMLNKVTETFLGEIEQIPPVYSAIKYRGKSLYYRVRKGQKYEIKPRKVKVYSFNIRRLKVDEIAFRLVCSKGTYVRSIANDFGEKLGVGGYLRELRRIRIGEFVLEGLNREYQNINFKVVE